MRALYSLAVVALALAPAMAQNFPDVNGNRASAVALRNDAANARNDANAMKNTCVGLISDIHAENMAALGNGGTFDMWEAFDQQLSNLTEHPLSDYVFAHGRMDSGNIHWEVSTTRLGLGDNELTQLDADQEWIASGTYAVSAHDRYDEAKSWYGRSRIDLNQLWNDIANYNAGLEQ